MTALSPLLNMVLGFVVVMSAVSMLVSAVVGIVHRLANRRARQLAEMLAATIYAYRKQHGDFCEVDDEASAAFVNDILNDAAVRSANQRVPGASARAHLPVDFVAQEDLIHIVEQRSSDAHLPRSWHFALSEQDASAAQFVAWLNKWFRTIEANASARFRKESRHIVGVVSAIAVVLLNLDALQLVSDLFSQAALSNALAQHAPGLVQLVDQGGAEGAPSQDVQGDLVQLNSVLNAPELRLGWQRSTFVEQYCAWRRTCSLPVSLSKTAPPPGSTLDFMLYAGFWLVGLALSALLLQLGAPFWADRLRDVLQLRNPVQKAKTATSPS